MYGLGNCPGDPGCPGYMPPQANALMLGLDQSAADTAIGVAWWNAQYGIAPTTTGSTLTAWLNANSTMVLGGVALLVGLMVVGKR